MNYRINLCDKDGRCKAKTLAEVKLCRYHSNMFTTTCDYGFGVLDPNTMKQVAIDCSCEEALEDA